MYLASPILFIILQQYPQIRRKACIYGLFTVSLALVLSSFCRTIPTLILTQGLLYALGGCFLYYPIYFFIDEWFVTRRGFAFGIMWAGTGVGGLSGPLIMGQLLEKFGFEIMIRSWAVAVLVVAGPLLWFVKPRLPVSRGSGGARWKNGWEFLTTRTFWILQAGNIVQGLGYFIPALYLPGILSLRPLRILLIKLTIPSGRIFELAQLLTVCIVVTSLRIECRMCTRGHPPVFSL